MSPRITRGCAEAQKPLDGPAARADDPFTPNATASAPPGEVGLRPPPRAGRRPRGAGTEVEPGTDDRLGRWGHRRVRRRREAPERRSSGPRVRPEKYVRASARSYSGPFRVPPTGSGASPRCHTPSVRSSACRGRPPEPVGRVERAVDTPPTRPSDAREGAAGTHAAQREAVVLRAAPCASWRARLARPAVDPPGGVAGARGHRRPAPRPRRHLTRKAGGELASRLSALRVRDQSRRARSTPAYAQLRPPLGRRGTAPAHPARAQGAACWRVRSARARRDGATRRRRRRDRWGEGADDRAGALRAEASSPRASRRSRSARSRRSTSATSTRSVGAGLVDFDDLLCCARAGAGDDREFAAGQRWRFRHLFVDEFQDVTPPVPLLHGWRGDRADLCVGGRPQPGHLQLERADVGFLTDFRDTSPGRPCCASTTTTARRPRSSRWPRRARPRRRGCTPTGRRVWRGR